MPSEQNHLGQPVGEPVIDWQPPPSPAREPLEGRWCRLEPLDPVTHGPSLYEANALDPEGRNWTYLAYGPFAGFAEYGLWLREAAASSDPLYFAIVARPTGRAVGVASYLRINPPQGVIEVGHLNFSPLLQATPAATEAMYLMMARAFALGYRRYEWKCHSLNAPSRRAALRLGFTPEGVFRQAAIVKGRNRDTAWYAITDQDWPALKRAFETWLDPANFDSDGQQRTSLSDLTSSPRQPPRET